MATTTAGSMLATRKVLGQIRLMPMQKMRIEPTVERLASAAAVMSGCKKLASRVRAPWSASTGIAAKMQPLPIDVVMVHTSRASMAPLIASVVQSPVMPSWMAPTMDMAPIATESDAVTKASTNSESPLLPVAYLSHSPKRSIWRSRSSISPMSDPSASETTTSAEPPAEISPPDTVSMPLMAPEMPMKMMATAVALRRVS